MCRHHADYEDLMDDNLPEAVRRFEANEPGVVYGNNNGASVAGTNEDSDPYDFEDNTKKPVEELSIGLPQAIVKSILSLGILYKEIRFLVVLVSGDVNI